MSIPASVRQDSLTLIRIVLGNLKIARAKDFETAQSTLKEVLNPQGYYQIPEQYRDLVKNINYAFNLPKLSAIELSDSDLEEYRDTIRHEITLKIKELKSLDDAQKQAYLTNKIRRAA
ncbi:hypothetical protein ACFORL_03020 [Legionella dresdenensis]|uniref:Uncharacterized protein n=1 Tax=Legionella dresdenensis TaxID=450200 RepID=A0ABV8CCV9_9GAMM